MSSSSFIIVTTLSHTSLRHLTIFWVSLQNKIRKLLLGGFLKLKQQETLRILISSQRFFIITAAIVTNTLLKFKTESRGNFSLLTCVKKLRAKFIYLIFMQISLFLSSNTCWSTFIRTCSILRSWATWWVERWIVKEIFC